MEQEGDVLPRSERLLVLWRMFSEGGAYTSQELAERFRVTPKTIRKDLRFLSGRYGLPLECIVESRWGLMRK